MRPVRNISLLLILLAGQQYSSATTTADLVAAFSEGKARAEGRARLVQNCARPSGGVPASLVAGYDDARASFNARIDALIAHIKANTLKDVDPQTELSRLNEGLNKVDHFAQSADEFMTRRRCNVFKKVALGPAAQLALNPETWRLIWDAYQKLSGNEAERAELIKQFDAHRIPEWSKVRLTVVFDWMKFEYLTGDQLTLPAIRKASTKVYINEWGLSTSEPAVLPSGERPLGLSPSYKLYSGDPEKLFITRPPKSPASSASPGQNR